MTRDEFKLKYSAYRGALRAVALNLREDMTVMNEAFSIVCKSMSAIKPVQYAVLNRGSNCVIYKLDGKQVSPKVAMFANSRAFSAPRTK